MRTSGTWKFGLKLFMACAAPWVFARAGQTMPAPDQQVLRVTTRLVVLNVVVHDKKGAPVAGLTREDFRILDGGREEKIAVFSVESGHEAKGPPAAPLGTNVFSNRLARGGRTPTNVVAILLDGLDTWFEDQVYARGQFIKFLAQLQPQDRVGLYVLGRRLSVIQDFTNDPAPLVEAIRQYRGRSAVPGSAAQNQAPEMRFEGLSGPAALAAKQLDAGLSSFSYVRQKTARGGMAYWHLGMVLSAFESIAHRLSGLPGHKSLIWVTGNLPPDPQIFPHLFDDNVNLFCNSWPGLSKEILETAQAVKRADLAVYPVNARGLVADPTYSALARWPSSPGAGLYGLNTVNLGMHYIAEQTGGRAFYNTNDLKGALRAALDDAEVTYTLGYYPSHGKWDGRYRAIKVLLNRKGVEVRHRQGYFARAETSIGSGPDRIGLLKDAALSPLDATGLGVIVRVTPFKGSRGGYKVEIALSPDLSDLAFQQVNGRWAGLIDVLAGQYSKQGKSLGGTTKSFSENLTDATYQEIMRKGLTISFYQDVARRAEELRVVVRDALSGSVGSVTIPLRQLLPVTQKE